MSREKPLICVVCSVRYSDNLGDGVIAACTEFLVTQVCKDVSVVHFDLAGRTAFRPRPAQRVSLTKRIFYALPGALRSIATLSAWVAFKRRHVATAWGACKPSGQYAFVFAGGQLISDVALNFPLKLGFVAKLVARDVAPLSFFAVGVSESLSRFGRSLIQGALDRSIVTYVGVRDRGSHDSFLSQFETAADIRQTVDPAVWVSEAFGIKRTINCTKRIGIGVANPSEIGLHDSGRKHEAGEYERLLRSVIDSVSEKGWVPVLFNNGSAEDELFMRSLQRKLRQDDVAFELAERPCVPRDLVETIAGFDGVIAHRLHASIVAYGLGIPCVGFEWDSKVQSFYSLCQIPHLCLPHGLNCGEKAADLIEAAILEPAEPERLRELKELATREMTLLISQIKK